MSKCDCIRSTPVKTSLCFECTELITTVANMQLLFSGTFTNKGKIRFRPMHNQSHVMLYIKSKERLPVTDSHWQLHFPAGPTNIVLLHERQYFLPVNAIIKKDFGKIPGNFNPASTCCRKCNRQITGCTSDRSTDYEGGNSFGGFHLKEDSSIFHL